MYKTKGQDVFLDAILKLEEKERNNLRIYIIGNLQGDQFEKEILSKAKSINNVIITGQLSREHIERVEDELDIYISSSREDSLPIVITEGLMRGKMCIVSNNTGFVDFFTPYKNGLIFESGNVDDLADKIRWALRHRSEFEKIGYSGQELYKKYFSMDSFEKRLQCALELI